VRRDENKKLMLDGDERLKGTKYLWLQNPATCQAQQPEPRHAQGNVLRTARAWAIKEAAMSLWDFTSWTRAKRAWLRW